MNFKSRIGEISLFFLKFFSGSVKLPSISFAALRMTEGAQDDNIIAWNWKN